MAIKLTNNTNLPGILGGALAPLVIAYAIALGTTVYPGMAVYFRDSAGKVVGPPRNNRTKIAFSVAPSSGDTLTVVLNGVSVSQAWDTDAATTMAALATKLANEPNIDTATVGDTNTSITITADAGYEAIVSSVANSDGTTTDTITPSTTDIFAGIVSRDRSEARDGVLKYEAPRMVSVLVDGDSISCGIGGVSGDTFTIATAPYVRLAQGDTTKGEYPGQIMASAAITAGRAMGALQSELSFDGAGAVDTYNFVSVTKGA